MSGSASSKSRGTWRWVTFTLLLVALPCASSVAHAQTDYTYTGTPFSMADPPYTTSDRLQGAFSVAVPLAPFSSNPFVDVLDYSFSDGVVTLTPANSVICAFEVSTDGAGHIKNWRVSLREANVNAGDPQQFMDSSASGGDQAGIAPADVDPCGMVMPTTIASSSAPGAWTDGLPPGAPTTYSYLGELFANADPPYTTSDRVTGSFEVAGPLPALLPSTEIAFALDDFSFTDGVQTRTPANTEVCSFEVATDPAGEIVAWRIGLRESGVGMGNAQQTMDVSSDGDQVGSAPAGAGPCDMVFPTLSASSATGGTWTAPLPPGVPITYTYTGEPFTNAQAPYTTSDRLTGSIDLANALPPFLTPTEIEFALDDFSFTDGVQTRTPANSIVCRLEVATDGEGNIIQWLVGLREAGVNPGDPQQTIDSSLGGDMVGSGPADNNPCGMISLAVSADNALPGTWVAPLPPAEPASYDYEGDPATFAETPYTVGDQLLGSISVAGQLPPNLASVDITPSLLDFSFSDGQQTRTPADTVVCGFRVGTDSAGEIVQWGVTLREAGVAPGNPQHSVDTFNSGSFAGDLFGTDAANADPCGNLVLSPHGSVDTPGTWIGDTPTGPAEIPTLSELAAILLVSLLAFAGLTILRQRG